MHNDSAYLNSLIEGTPHLICEYAETDVTGSIFLGGYQPQWCLNFGAPWKLVNSNGVEESCYEPNVDPSIIRGKPFERILLDGILIIFQFGDIKLVGAPADDYNEERVLWGRNREKQHDFSFPEKFTVLHLRQLLDLLRIPSTAYRIQCDSSFTTGSRSEFVIANIDVLTLTTGTLENGFNGLSFQEESEACRCFLEMLRPLEGGGFW